MYSGKIKEAANGRRRGIGCQERETEEVVSQRRFQGDVQVDEQSGAAQNGEDEAKGQAYEEKEEALRLTTKGEAFSRNIVNCRSVIPKNF